MKTKIKNFFKENYKFILFIILIAVFFNIKLPYYIMAPGGAINITDRVLMDDYQKDKEGSLNMLYVAEYEATPASMLLAKLKNWEIDKNEERQITDESVSDIEKRNKIMRDNSLDIATLVAYTEAGKKITITEEKNIVIATTMDNGLEVGDVIVEADGKKCKNIDEIKEVISSKEVDDYIEFKVIRDNDEKKIKSRVVLDNNTKVIGVVIITEYDYDKEPEVDIKFKDSESGSSGGLMLALTIYNAISGEDIIKRRNIAGTGTISVDGTVGEIDGIKYKIMGAAEDNMDIVLVPEDNYEEAIRTKNTYNYDMEIVMVKTFREAINYLNES